MSSTYSVPFYVIEKDFNEVIVFYICFTYCRLQRFLTWRFC